MTSRIQIALGRTLKSLTLGLALIFVSAASFAADKPQRIVSLNVCTDQHLMLLVEPERIASVTYLANDPQTSTMVEKARNLPINHGLAEEIIPLEPDLILAGSYSARPTVNLLQKLGYNLVELEPEASLEDFRRNLRTVAEAVREEEKAEAIIAGFDARLAALATDMPENPPVFADYGANGLTSGKNSLVADIAHHAGMVTLGEKLGFFGSRFVSVEQFLMSEPDIVSVNERQYGAPALASEQMNHPALEAFAHQALAVEIPVSYWVCGTPKSLDALETLVKGASQGRESRGI